MLHVLARLDVEVRFGLVEQQHVGVAQQAGGEPDELALAAGEDARRLVEVVVVEADIREEAPARGLRSPGRRRRSSARCSSSWRRSRRASFGHVGACSASCASTLREVGLELVEVGPRRAQRLQRVAVVALELLRQEREHEPAPRRDLARVGGLLAGQDAQQRRLAAAVRPDDPQADARLDVEVEPVEDQPRAEALRDPACLQQGHAPRLDVEAGTRARRAGGSRRPTDGRRRHRSTRPSCGRARPDPRACRGTAAAARRSTRSRVQLADRRLRSGQPLFHGSTSQTATRRPRARAAVDQVRAGCAPRSRRRDPGRCR